MTTSTTLSESFKLENARLASGTSWSPPLFPQDFTIPSDATHKLTHRRLLRFNGSDNTNVAISPSGLVLVNNQNTMREVFLTQYFSSGVHLWELFCPQDCYGVSFGIKNKQADTEITLELLASTSKSIIFKLDLEKLIFSSWVNLSTSHKNSRREISKGEWTGFVRFKGVGKSIILNPTPIDPEGEISPYNPYSQTGSSQGQDMSTTPKVSEEEEREVGRQEPCEGQRLIKVNEKKWCVVSGNKLRVIHRNTQTNRFQLDNISRVSFVDDVIHIEVSFNSDDFQQLRSFCESTNLKFFKRNVNKVKEYFYLQYTLNEWDGVLRQAFAHCDTLFQTLRRFKEGNSATGGNVISEEQLITIYRILNEKVEQIKPHLFSPLRELECLQMTQSSRWDYSQQFFKRQPHRFSVSKSIFQNNFPPLEFPSQIEDVYSSDKYLLVRTKESLDLFNTQLVPVKMMTLDIQKGFDKSFQLQKFTKAIESFQVVDPNQPKLYKILADCLVESKLAKRIVKPKVEKEDKPKTAPSPVSNPKTTPVSAKKKEAEPFVDQAILSALITMGFPPDKCKQALIETKNVSVDAALEHLIVLLETELPKIEEAETPSQKTSSKQEWPCQVCTLINYGGSQCSACTTPRPPQAQSIAPPQQPLKQELKQTENRISEQIIEPLRDLGIIETGSVNCPLIIVALFESQVRVRVVGPNPTYLNYFYINNDQMNVDLSNLVPEFSISDISQAPITHLEQLFNDNTRPLTFRFGWITLEDSVIAVKAETMKVKRDNVVELDNKKYQVEMNLEKIYEPMRNSIRILTEPQLHPLIPTPEQTSSVSYSRQVLVNSNNSLDIDLIFTQTKAGDQSVLSTSKIVSLNTQPLSKSSNTLPLVVHSAPSCCNFQYPLTSIIYGQNNKIIFKHQHGKVFTVETVILQTLGLKQANPMMKKGYVYMTNHLERQPTIKYLFQIDCNQETVSFVVGSNTPSKYLIIQPVIESAEEENQPPFEMFLYCITGTSLEPSDSLPNRLQLLQKYMKLQLQGRTEDGGVKRLDQYSVSEEVLNDPLQIDHLSSEGLNLRVQEYLKNNIPVDILVRVSVKNISSLERIRIKELSIEGWKLVGLKMRSSRLQSDSKRFINRFIEEVLKNGDEETTNALSTFISNNEFTTVQLFQSITIQQLFTFINRAHSHSSGLDLKQMIGLVREITNSTELKSKLDSGALVLLLDSQDLTILGLQFVIELLKELNGDMEPILQRLTQSLNRVSELRSAQYSEERKKGNYHLSLQNQYFSSFYYQEVEKESRAEDTTQNRILSKFVMINHNSWRKYIIDLTNRISVESLTLSFENNIHKKHLFIQIYKPLSQTQKQLVFQGYYEDWIWQQLCRGAYSEDTLKIIQNTESLNSLVFRFENLSTRYLVIELNYDLVGTSNNSVKSLVTSEIIPEVFGSYEGEADPLFIQYFDIASTKPTFISYAKFHKLSQFSKYIIKKNNWSNYYYDNEEVSKAKKDSGLSPSKLKQLTNPQVRGLDYHYTLLCKIIQLFSKTQYILPLPSILSLYKELAQQEQGPIKDKAISLIRKCIASDEKIFIEIVRVSKGEDTLEMLRDIPFKQNIILEELTKNPSEQLVLNLLILLKLQRMKNLDVIDKIVQYSTKVGLGEKAVFLLQTYPWTASSSALIKQLLRSDKETAFRLVRDCKDKNLLIKDVKNWLDSDEQLFDQIITHITMEPSEEVSREFQAIISKLLERRGKKTYSQMAKIIKLSECYGIDEKDLNKLLSGFDDVKNAYDLLSRVISIVFSKEKGSEKLVEYLNLEISRGLADNNLNYRNLNKIVHSLKTFEISEQHQREIVDSLIKVLILKCTFGGYQGLRLTKLDQYLSLYLSNQLCDLITNPLENTHLQSLVEWYMLNNSPNTDLQTPSHQLFHQLKSKKVESIILKSQEHSTKHIIQIMFKTIKQLDAKIENIHSIQHRAELDSEVMESFKNLYSKLVIPPELLEEIFTSVGLFQYVVDRINRFRGEVEAHKINRVNLTNTLTLINKPNPPQDWLMYKNGNNTNQVLTINFSSDSSVQVLAFKADTPVLLDNILISFLVNTGDKKMIHPKSVELWIGSDPNDVHCVGTMDVVEDHHYSASGTKVFGINLRNIESKSLDSYIQGLNEITPVQFIKFIVERSEPISIEDVLGVTHKPVSTSAKVSFVSLTGTNKPIQKYVPSLLPIFPMLSQIYNKSNQQTLSKLLEDQRFVSLLKQGLQGFCSSMEIPQYFQTLHSFILAISKNDQLGDFIIDKYLCLQNSNICSQLVFEIVLSNYDLLENRLLKLHHFLISNIGSEIKYNIVPFIVRQTKILQLISLDLQKSPALITLTFSEQDLDTLLQILYTTKLFKLELLEFISTLLLLRAPLTLSFPNPVQKALQSLEREWRTNDVARKLFAILIIGNEEASIWALDENRVDTIIDLLKESISANAPVDKIVPILDLLTEMCYSPKIKNYLQKKQVGLDLFKLLTRTDNDNAYLHKPQNVGMRKSFVSFINNSLLGTTSERDLAILLKQSLENLITTFSNEYVIDVFLPILNSSTTVPVCFEGYDTENSRYVLKPCSDLKQHSKTEVPSKPVPVTLTSKILPQNEISELQKMINYNFTPSLVLYQSKSQGEGLFNVVKNKILKQHESFLILVEARNKISSKLFAIYHQNKNTSTNNSTYDWNQQSFIVEYTRFQNESQWKTKLHKSKGVMIAIEVEKNSPEECKMAVTAVGNVNLSLSFSSGPSTIDGDFKFTSAEYFSLKSPITLKQTKESPNESLVGNILSSIQNPQIIDSKYFKEGCAVNYLRRETIYHLPKEIIVSHLKQMFNVLNYNPPLSKSMRLYRNNFTEECKDKDTLGSIIGRDSVIADIEYNYKDIFNEEFIKNINSAQPPLDFLPSQTILNSFQREKGFDKLIYVVESGISSWKNLEVARKWKQYVQELKNFSSFPRFFAVYMKEKETIDLLLNILIGLPDKEDNKKWQEMESKATKNLYKNVSDVLSLDYTVSIREHAIKNKFISTILERLHLLSKQPKRKFVPDYQEEKVVENSNNNKGDDGKQKMAKKKGTGYGNDTSSNTKWATNEKIESSKELSEQLEHILAILENFLNVSNWKVPKEIVGEFMESCLLPLIENTLRAGTLLEISKDSKRVMAVLNLLVKMSKHNELIPCLHKISHKYQPSQSQSILDLLKGLADTAQIFVSCLNPDVGSSTLNTASNTENNKSMEQNSKKIIAAWEKISDVADNYDENVADAEDQLNSILAQPSLMKRYKQLLKDLKFDYINMKQNKQKHHYSSSSSTPSTNSNKLIRLAQELADLSTSLPTEHTNAIYVRCDKERIDYMQALIMGSNGTPYGHGAFLFDIYFDQNYPTGPPKVNLTTTGSAKVRFNPNLYACGKVCLSLLGTWRGSASENWDPKLSTLLQVLVSIQAIIMSDDIYFNEPGFEGEQGTEQGNRRNQAYSNIVRYCNVKFAMTGNIKNPPNGFQTVIRRHFYLKKQEILEEVEKWVKTSEKREASYVGLVNDHNSFWCTEFKTKNKYPTMLKEAFEELKKELDKLSAPSINDITPKRRQANKKPKGEKEKEKVEASQVANLDEVDVSYNQESLTHKELDINDETVKNRWSRYIGAMGIDAVSRQAKASILVFGLGPFSLQVIKNLILSGCKRLTICDDTNVSIEDLSGGFYFQEGDVGKNRVTSCLHKLQELNQYVKVDHLQKFGTDNLALLKEYTLVMMTEGVLEDQIIINDYCRTNGVKFILANARGPFFRLFNDFGDKFQVLDKNGEEPVEVMIKSITNEERGIVTLLEGAKHPYEDGEVVVINNVNGMQNLQDPSKSINASLHKVTTINSNSFFIEDTRGFQPYTGNGTAKNVKLPVSIKFDSLKDVSTCSKQKLPIDQNMCIYDFSKMEHNSDIHFAFLAVDIFFKNQKRYPNNWDQSDADKLISICTEVLKETPNNQRLVRIFSFTYGGNLPPLCAFFGGYVAQEVVKAITQKYKPTKSLFYGHFTEVVPKLPEAIADWPSVIDKIKIGNERTRGLEIVVGKELITKLEECKVFMIGAGAIGCELLKNFAMINLGCGKDGMITLTDPDHIETSNLNRQFLFREKHIRKPKSSTAAASAIQMNPLLKGHVSARLDKIHDATKGIYSDEFFQSLNIVANALDNVQARRYVDQRCVDNKIPLLQSGTLGPKGHVQVIIPYKTESYGSKNDPNDEGGQIPHCTLKMFPEETLHCIEWARDKFGQKFSLQPKSIIKVIDKSYKADSSDKEILKKVLRKLEKKPVNFDDCIHAGLLKFYSYYRNNIKQLLYTYPLDAKTKNGDPFWKLPKRPPTPIEQFDPEDTLHCTFVSSYAVMLAKIFNIIYPKDFRSEKQRKEIGAIAAKFKVSPFVPSDKKAKEIMKETKDNEKEENEQEKEKEEVKIVGNQESEEEILDKIRKIVETSVEVSAEEFEKDDDANGHIDFIYAMANLRSLNYKLDPMDWVTTKLKAGRIVPALSTTTTSIAGLQTLELVKYLANLELTEMRNTFLNLAVPLIQLSEPGEASKTKIHDDLSFTIWDRWEVKCSEKSTMEELFQNLQKTYKLKPKDILQSSKPIYLSSTFDIPGKEKQKKDFLKGKLLDVLEREENLSYIDLIVTFAKEDQAQLIKDVPKVRLNFGE